MFLQLQVYNLIHTCALSHLSLFVMGLLIVSGGKGLREVSVIFDSQFDLHIQSKKCEPFTLCVHSRCEGFTLRQRGRLLC